MSDGIIPDATAALVPMPEHIRANPEPVGMVDGRPIYASMGSRDLLGANIELREQRDAAREDLGAALEEVSTLSLRVQRLEREAQVLYELLCKASENAQEQARTTVAQAARAAALRRERFGQ